LTPIVIGGFKKDAVLQVSSEIIVWHYISVTIAYLLTAKFVDIVTWVAEKLGKMVIKIDRFTPYSGYGHRQKLTLKQRICVSLVV